MPASAPIQARRHGLGGKNESVRGLHGQWSWLTPKCPNPDAYRPTTMPNADRGPLSVVHSCRVILSLDLLAADHLEKLDPGAICTFHASLVYA
jgi:hypothetical protein